MISKEVVIKLAEERIKELDSGCYLVDVKIDAANRICVEADNETRGISVQECVSISRNIEHNLDREEEDFSLEVSSPGLTEGFKVWRQYKKNIGRQVKVKPHDGSELKGTLEAADEDGFQLKTETKQKIEGRKKKEKVIKEYQFKYDQVKETKIIIAFK